MFELKITGIYEASCCANLCTKIIGVIDPNTQHIDTDNPYHIERFHDIPIEFTGFIAPSVQHIQNILNFSKDFTDNDKVLIHCHAGVSRSTAVALLICIQHGMTIEESFDYVYNVRDFMHPNNLIIQYGDELLGLDGKLIDYYDKWLYDKGMRYGVFAGQSSNTNTQAMKDILAMFK